MEQLWTRLFIPINSLPSRIPLHVRYFPRNLHRGRSIFEAGRYSEPWPRFGLRPFEIATNETNLCWESVEDRPRGGLKLGGEQRAEEKGGMEKKGSHLGRPKTLPLPLATTRLRNSWAEFNRDGNCFLLTVMKALGRPVLPFRGRNRAYPWPRFNWNPFEEEEIEGRCFESAKIVGAEIRGKYAGNANVEGKFPPLPSVISERGSRTLRLGDDARKEGDRWRAGV